MTTIQERIERGRQIVEAEMLEQEEKAQAGRDRAERAWAQAFGDAVSYLPEDLRQYASLKAKSPHPAGTMTLKLEIPRLAPIIVKVDTRYQATGKGYEGFDYKVVGLHKKPYVVCTYFAGWVGSTDMRAVETTVDGTAYESIDVALYLAEEEEANLPAVNDEVNCMNEEMEQSRSDKAANRRKPEAAIADTLVKLLNMVRDYTEPEPY